eukprot:COSAG02_NODE_479_length_21477_cov_49.737674_13_plen_286_part_00
MEPSFLELSCEAVAEVIGNDELAVEAAAVVSAMRAWFDHDVVNRTGSLVVLLPLVRWPQLPVEARLNLPDEPLLQRMIVLAPKLGMKLLLECSAEFAASGAAAACPRLKRRKGTLPPVLPLAFTSLSDEHYTTSEDGALLTNTASTHYRAALCRERVMNSGRSCAEVTVRQEHTMMIGVGRPTLDPNAESAYLNADFWGLRSTDGTLFHNGNAYECYGRQGYGTGDVLRVLLDSDAGTLTTKKNGTLLNVAVPSGLTGDLCWAVAFGSNGAGSSVRIKALDPAEF